MLEVTVLRPYAQFPDETVIAYSDIREAIYAKTKR